MYAKFTGTVKNKKLIAYHHITSDNEFKEDCKVWLSFLDESEHSVTVCRPWMDILSHDQTATLLDFCTDASGARDRTGGMRCVFDNEWTSGMWSEKFMKWKKPSIKYLGLFALCVGMLIWSEKLRNFSRMIMHCDNQDLVNMVNNLTSGCKNCMKLLHILLLRCLNYNFRVFVQYITSKEYQVV